MNIEKTISEQAVSDILTPMLESQDRIVTEDVAPLFDQATGLDTPPASGTVTTTIEESRNLISAIIRKAWTATLTMLGGASVISYIAAAYTYLRNRLKGNETYGIPDRRSEISASSPLAANLALLNDRKISGVPEAADGISLANLIGSGYTDIEEVNDTNHGWSWVDCYDGIRNQSRGIEKFFTRFFPSLKKITLNCKSIVGKGGDVYLLSSTSLEEIYFPELETYTNTWYSTFFNGCTNLLVLEMPNFASFYESRGNGGYIGVGCNKLRRAVFGNMAGINKGSTIVMQSESPDLIHLEFGHNGIAVAESMNLSVWNPTNALDASRTDLIEEGSTAQNNLQQFLQNFRYYIALRLTDNGSGKTLTLSQAVRNAIHAAESTYGIENIIITQKCWTISPAPN